MGIPDLPDNLPDESRATYISTYLIYSNLGETHIRAISGALLHHLFIDQPIPPDKFADIVYEDEVSLNEVPREPVIKMAKSEHVDAFFRDGTILLGTFAYYNKFDHEEIGDTSEGSFILVGQHPPTTAFVEISGGFNNYVFCCYAGEPDDHCIQRFGYDASYQVIDVAGFAGAIQDQINARDYWHSKCAYSNDKVLVGNTPKGFDFNVISARLLDLVNTAKYFVKPSTYSHQSEFRYVWRMPSDVEEPLIIKCPDAVNFCRRR